VTFASSKDDEHYNGNENNESDGNDRHDNPRVLRNKRSWTSTHAHTHTRTHAHTHTHTLYPV